MYNKEIFNILTDNVFHLITLRVLHKIYLYLVSHQKEDLSKLDKSSFNFKLFHITN